MQSTILFTGLLIANAGDSLAQQPLTLESLQSQLKAQQQTVDAQQQQLEDMATVVDDAAAASATDTLAWQGYGVVNYQKYDFYKNVQDETGERRARTDLERIVFAASYDFGDGYSFFAEIEFEHGGTGATVEFEKEEFGEFEIEVEKGGEVVLEQAHLVIEHNPAVNFRIGEIVVPFGMINSHHQPSQYFTIERSLAETNLIPSVWHEAGVEWFGSSGQLRYQIQLITALDSSGFSGYSFVRNGVQGKQEFDHSDDIAFVARLDYALAHGVLVGSSVYFGDSAGNRSRKNLDGRANVTLWEVHGRYQHGPLIVRGEYLSGTIENSDQVTRANQTAFSSGVLGISQTSVGHRATGWFIESGYDVLPLLAWSDHGILDVFARAEAWNSHAEVEGSIVAVDRYDREALTIGVNYKPRPGIVFKSEFSRRENAGVIASAEDVFGLGLGFEF